jgi:hypothetical protein
MLYMVTGIGWYNHRPVLLFWEYVYLDLGDKYSIWIFGEVSLFYWPGGQNAIVPHICH